jgi:hypothetical protein
VVFIIFSNDFPAETPVSRKDGRREECSKDRYKSVLRRINAPGRYAEMPGVMVGIADALERISSTRRR